MRFVLKADIPAVLDLTINVRVEGGESFLAETPVNRIGMAAGDDTAWLILSTVDDKVHEDDDDIEATVLDGSRYDPGDQDSATVRVRDNDPLPPPKVTGVTATLTGTDSVRVAWDRMPGAAWYRVEYRTSRDDDDDWRFAANVSASRALTFSWPVPLCLTTYYFRVIAWGDGTTYAAEYGPPSTDSASVTTISPCPTIDTPTGFEATGSTPKTVDLRWNVLTDVGAYRVEYRVRGSATWSTRYIYSGAADTVPNLLAHTTYEFRLSARGDGYPFSLTYSAPTPNVRVPTANTLPVIEGPSLKIYEENGRGTVASYSARDDDKDTVTLSLSGNDANDFNFSGGALTFKSPPNYENPTDANINNIYGVTVEADDGHGGTRSRYVTIIVTDVNDRPVVAAQIGNQALTVDGGSRNVGLSDKFSDEDGDTLTYTAVCRPRRRASAFPWRTACSR